MKMIGQVTDYAFERVWARRIKTTLDDICSIEKLMQAKRERLKKCRHPHTEAFELIQTKIDSFKEMASVDPSKSMLDHMDQIRQTLDEIVLEVRDIQASTSKYCTDKDRLVRYTK